MGPIEAAGTYKVEGEQLNITVTDVKAGGRSVMALLPPQIKDKLNQKVLWKIEGDTMTLTNAEGPAPAAGMGKDAKGGMTQTIGGQAQTLTRVKE